MRQLNPREVATIAQALRVAAHVYGSDAKRGDIGKRQAEEAVAMADTFEQAERVRVLLEEPAEE